MHIIRRAGVIAPVACAIASFSLAGIADELPVSRIDRERAYATLDDAAVAALRLAMSVTPAYEWGGALFRCGQDYFPSLPVTSGDSEHVSFRIAQPSGCEVAGIYHTHPGDSEHANRFSADDVRTARRLKIPSYIGILRNGRVRVFDGAAGRASVSSQYSRQGATSEGRLVASLSR